MLITKKMYLDLFRNIPKPILVYDSKTLAFIEVNKCAQKKYGYTHNEFLKMNLKDIISGEFKREFLKIRGRKNSPGGNIPIISHRGKNGRAFFVTISSSKIEFEGKKAILIIPEDISENNEKGKRGLDKELSELLLQYSVERKRMQDILANLPGVVWEAWGAPDASLQRVDFISDYVETMLGYSVEEWLSTPGFWLSIVHPDDKEKAANNAKATFKSKEGGVNQFRWIKKDGKVIWTEAHSVAIRDEKGKAIGMRGVNLDITSSKEAEAEIKTRVRQNAAIAEIGRKALEGASLDELMNNTVIVLKDILKCEYVKIVEFLPKENMFLLKAGLGWDKGLIGNAKVGAGNKSQAGYTLLVNEPVIVEDLKSDKRFKKATLLFDKTVVSGMSVVIRGREHPYGVLSVHTDHRRLFSMDDAYFLRAIANIIAASVERKKSENELEISLKEKEVLLKEIHHRVKNNLQVVSSLLNLQSKYIVDSESLEAFNESQNRIKSMALIHEKLYQSKSLLRINFEEYANDLLLNLFNSYHLGNKSISPEINIKNIHINIDTAVSLGLIINELTSNSLKHAFSKKEFYKTNGKIIISMERKKNGIILLSIKDNGSGLPDDFDFRNTSTLGLQLVCTLVEQLEGKIEARNNKGAEFIIIFTLDK